MQGYACLGRKYRHVGQVQGNPPRVCEPLGAGRDNSLYAGSTPRVKHSQWQWLLLNSLLSSSHGDLPPLTYTRRTVSFAIFWRMRSNRISIGLSSYDMRVSAILLKHLPRIRACRKNNTT